MYSYVTSKKTKTDCFAFHKDSCTALIDRICDNKDCRFYKTHQEFKETRTPALPTISEERLLLRNKLNPEDWLVVDNTKLAIIIYNRKTKEIKTIEKRRGRHARAN